jgi:hypothetical protein
MAMGMTIAAYSEPWLYTVGVAPGLIFYRGFVFKDCVSSAPRFIGVRTCTSQTGCGPNRLRIRSATIYSSLLRIPVDG